MTWNTGAGQHFFASNPPMAANGKALEKGGWAYVVKAYGAKGDGATIDTTAILAAAADAKAVIATPGTGGILFFGAGAYKADAQLSLSGVTVLGVGRDFSQVTCSAALGGGTPFIILDNGLATADRNTSMADIYVNGPSLGSAPPANPSKTANVDGIQINSKMQLRNVRVRAFDSGFVWNTTVGHITIDNCAADANYYGIYEKNGTGDDLIIDSEINGNNFANLGIAGNTSLNVTVIRTHLGFCSFGIYQESGSNGLFLNQCFFLDAKFEQIGNASLFTSQWNDSGKGLIQGIKVLGEPGHLNFNTNWQRTDTAWDYDIWAGGECSGYIEEYANGFLRGARGTIRAQSQNGVLIYEKRVPSHNAPCFVSGDGTFAPARFHYYGGYNPRGSALVVTGSIAAGQSTVTLADSNYVVPKAAAVQLQLTGMGGATGVILTPGALVSSPTLATPGNGGVGNPGMGAAPGAAGNVDVGLHRYVCTYVNSIGETTAGATVDITISASAKHVSLTLIPTCDVPVGAPAVTRNIYRSKAGTTSPLFRIAASPTLNDNTTATFDDNVADAALTAVQPPGSTTTEGLSLPVTSNAAAVGSAITFNAIITP